MSGPPNRVLPPVTSSVTSPSTAAALARVAAVKAPAPVRESRRDVIEFDADKDFQPVETPVISRPSRPARPVAPVHTTLGAMLREAKKPAVTIEHSTLPESDQDEDLTRPMILSSSLGESVRLTAAMARLRR